MVGRETPRPGPLHQDDQHSNRDNDPHLHVHNVMLNLVQRADGADETYRTLDGKPLLRARGQLDAIAKRLLARKLAGAGIPLVQRPGGDGFEVGASGRTRSTRSARGGPRSSRASGWRTAGGAGGGGAAAPVNAGRSAAAAATTAAAGRWRRG
jgi:hypothetical protein